MWEPTEIRRPVGGGNVNLSCRYFQVHVKAEEIRLVGAGEPRRQGFQAEMDTEQQLISDPFLQAERQIWLSEAKEPLGFLNSERRRLDYPIGGLAQPLAKWAASNVVRLGSSKDHVLPSAKTTVPLICSQLASQSLSWRLCSSGK